MLAGCEEVGDFDKFMAELDDKKAAEGKCMSVRTDGRSVDIDGDYTETLASINTNLYSFGVFGLAFYENNTNEIEVATINGVRPSQETVANGAYPVSRPLYFYVKNANATIIPGIWDYVRFFVSDDMAGPNSALAEYGLVSDPELAATQEMLTNK